MRRHLKRTVYRHFKDADSQVKAQVIANQTGFFDACAQGLFCNLGDGQVDFHAVRAILPEHGNDGCCTVEQDCGPQGENSPLYDDAKANREYLQ